MDDIKLNKWANKEALGISPLKFGKFIMVSNEERNSRNSNKLPSDHYFTIADNQNKKKKNIKSIKKQKKKVKYKK